MEKDEKIVLRLRRLLYYDDRTVGSLDLLDGSACTTIERKKGKRYVTQSEKVSQCLPEGEYKLKLDVSTGEPQLTFGRAGFARRARFEYAEIWKAVQCGSILLCYDFHPDTGYPCDKGEALRDFVEAFISAYEQGRVKVKPNGVTNVVLRIEEAQGMDFRTEA